MKFSAVMSCLVVIVAASLVSQANAITEQTVANVFDGRPFLYVEGESYASLNNGVFGDYNGNGSVDAADYVQWRNGGPLLNEVGGAATLGITDAADYDAWRARFGDNSSPTLGWKTVTKGGPDLSFESNLPILPATSNVSGSAIWAQQSTFNHSQTAKYEVKFVTAGTYQIYLRHSMYDTNTSPGTFGNEDSIYMSPAFNKNSSTDWVGFQGLEFDNQDLSVDLPVTGDALDPDGFKPSTGDHVHEGLLELSRWGNKDDDVFTPLTPAGTYSANGNFSWYNNPTFHPATSTGGFIDFQGFKTEYTVTPGMVGQTLTFEVGTREVNVVIDGFMFIKIDNPYPNSDLFDLYSQAEVDAGVLPGPGAGAAVPEPASLLMFVIGMVAFRGMRVRRSC
jgi:hypothetical protein